MTIEFLLGVIPSPSSGSIHLGPLRLNAYGLMIALGVIVAVRIAGRRAENKGVGTTEDISSIAMWAVPAGVIGGRAYHVLTDYQRFQGQWFDAIKIWQGGLGIWGGVTVGVAVGWWCARRRGLDAWWIISCAAPAIAIAQAIGRWGNWFNQELFGRPTTVPWALEGISRVQHSTRPFSMSRWGASCWRGFSFVLRVAPRRPVADCLLGMWPDTPFCGLEQRAFVLMPATMLAACA
jgi:prolipoprotein diacylglyceryl transferase